MLWLVTWIAVFAVAALGVVASANSLRFRRRVASEARHLYAGPNEPFHIDRTRLQELPPSVRRYLARAIGSRDIAIRTARLGHGGVFRTKLDGAWLPIRGEQYFSAAPPGFVWWGRIRIAPGLWVDARDRSVEGVGSMRILLESTFALGDSSGAELDQGALLRLLGEMVWLPTSLADERYVSWSALDEGTAEARLRVDAREVSALFEFGADGLPAGLRRGLRPVPHAEDLFRREQRRVDSLLPGPHGWRVREEPRVGGALLRHPPPRAQTRTRRQWRASCRVAAP